MARRAQWTRREPRGRATKSSNIAWETIGRRARRMLRCDHQALEQLYAVLAAFLAVHGALRVRHHAEDTAVFGQNAGDIPRRSVGIAEIAESHATLAFQPVKRRFVGEVVAVMVRN